MTSRWHRQSITALTLFVLALLYRDRLMGQETAEECEAMCVAGCQATTKCTKVKVSSKWDGKACSCSGCKCAS